MRTYIGLVAGLMCNTAFGIDSYDQKYLQHGAVNKDFQIIDYDKYINVTRLINNEFAKRLPAQVDSMTTYTMVKLSRDGLKISLYIQGIDTEEELKNTLDGDLFLQLMKNRICGKMPMINSEFFKRTTKGNIVYEINNEMLKNLENYSINYKDCF